jgi:hypothetical protein
MTHPGKAGTEEEDSVLTQRREVAKSRKGVENKEPMKPGVTSGVGRGESE